MTFIGHDFRSMNFEFYPECLFQ